MLRPSATRAGFLSRSILLTMMHFFSSLFLTTTGRRHLAPALAARWAMLLLLLAAPLLGRAQAPTISGFSPASGPAGTSVVLTGSNFAGATGVTFNGTAAPGFVVNSSTQLTVPVPAGATTGPITVTKGPGGHYHLRGHPLRPRRTRRQHHP